MSVDMTKWQDHVGEEIRVTYTAVVNSNAVEAGTIRKKIVRSVKIN